MKIKPKDPGVLTPALVPVPIQDRVPKEPSGVRIHAPVLDKVETK